MGHKCTSYLFSSSCSIPHRSPNHRYPGHPRRRVHPATPVPICISTSSKQKDVVFGFRYLIAPFPVERFLVLDVAHLGGGGCALSDTGRATNTKPANSKAHVALGALILFPGTQPRRRGLSGTSFGGLDNLFTISKIPIFRRSPFSSSPSLFLSFLSLLSFNHFLTQGHQTTNQTVCLNMHPYFSKHF